jgi:hypothetical protein
MTLTEIFFHLGIQINKLIKKEHTDQGHYLTGTLENSLQIEILGNTLTGLAISYAKIVNEGLSRDKISMKMLPKMEAYFRLRGLPDNEAKKAAFFTIQKWGQEGMSTEASSRFSKTGERQHFIERALENPKVDNLMFFNLDKAFDQEYSKTKSEII